MKFCRVLNALERNAGRLADGWEYTLPTEAQWERACRATTETGFCFGDDLRKLGEYAWIFENAENLGEKYAHRVGQKMPNRWGLHDMHGNIWEWCRDHYTEKLPGGRDPEVTESSVPESKRRVRVIRGGCFANEGPECGSACRHIKSRAQGDRFTGFRVALIPVQPAK
jgi:formylglycine-generating enzyme required for sulfatase activity